MTAEEKEAAQQAAEAKAAEERENGGGDGSDGEEGGGGGAGGGNRSQFKTHMKKSEAASDFSRNKTIGQQRRSLPVYTVREDLLQVWMDVWGHRPVREQNMLNLT